MAKTHRDKIALVAPPWWLIPSNNVITATEHLVEDYAFNLKKCGYPNVIFSRAKDHTDKKKTHDINEFKNEYNYTKVSQLDRRYFKNNNNLFFYLFYIIKVSLKIRILGIKNVLIFQSFPFCFWIRLFNPSSKILFHIGSHELSRNENYFNYGYITDELAHRVLPKVNTIITVSKCIKKGIISRFPEFESKCQNIYPGIDTDTFKHKNNNCNSPTIIFTGRVVPEKGVDVLISAFKNLRRNFKNLRLYIVGGNIGPNVKDYSQEIYQVKGIKSFGLQTRKKTAQILSKGSIFVYPVIMEEAFGLAPIEAMSTGLVTIVSKTNSGYAEIIKEGFNGFYFESMNVNDLERVLKRVLLQDNREIINNGIKTIKEELSWKQCIENTIKYFCL